MAKKEEDKIPKVVEAYLAPDQNIFDQEPFIRIPGLLKEKNFLKDPGNNEGVGFLIRVVIDTPQESMGRAFGSSQRFSNLRSYVTHWNSGVAMVARDVKGFLLQFPYAQQYLQENRRTFTLSGRPIHQPAIRVLTFSSYQIKLLTSDGIRRWDGLLEIFPVFFPTEDVKQAMETHNPAGRIWKYRAGIQGRS